MCERVGVVMTHITISLASLEYTLNSSPSLMWRMVYTHIHIHTHTHTHTVREKLVTLLIPKWTHTHTLIETHLLVQFLELRAGLSQWELTILINTTQKTESVSEWISEWLSHLSGVGLLFTPGTSITSEKSIRNFLSNAVILQWVWSVTPTSI